MKKQILSSRFLLALAASLAVSISCARAADASFTISTTSTTKQSLGNGQAGVVTSTGKLSTASGTLITIDGTSTSPANQITITNSGSIKDEASSGGGRTIRDASGGSNSLITNNAGGLIQGAQNDVIALNVNGSATTSASVMVIKNSGTIQSIDDGGTGASTPTAKGNQAINMTVTTGANEVDNLSTGVIWATAADSVRPGLNGVVHNDGFIYSNAFQGSSSDGIDAQSDTGIVIVNGFTTTTPGGTVAAFQGTTTMAAGGVNTANVALTQSTIEGGRHGITGGNTGTNTSSPVYQDTLNPTDPGVYTMSVTNNQGALIEGQNGSGINIDGFGFFSSTAHQNVTNELVTVTNHGTITGDGVTGDGDGIDVDGAVIVDNSGSIISKNAAPESGDPVGSIEFSEGITVGGGTITNEKGGVIEGEVAAGNTSGVGRGITLAGVDKGADDSAIPIESVYGYFNPSNSSQLIDPSITNSGLIKGDSESGIAVLGTTGGGATVTITNNASGIIEGNNTGVSEDQLITSGAAAGQMNGQSLNQGAIELDDTGNSYVINNSGTIRQDNAAGTAVAMHGSSNQLNILGGSASIIGNVSGDTAADSTLTINPGNGGIFTYGYGISNFTVQINADGGNGTVNLAATSSNTGSTTVNTGTLDISGSIAHSATTVKSTATLKGSGSVGDVTVKSGGILSPGDAATSIGATQALSSSFQFKLNSLTLDGGSTLSFSLYNSGAPLGAGTAADPAGSTMLNMGLGAFNAGADVTAGSVVLNLNGTAENGTVTDPNVYQLAEFGTNNSTLTLSDFSVKNLNSDAPTYGLEFVNLGGGETALDLEVAPEPGTWALMLAGLGLLPFIGMLRRQLARD